MRAHAHKITNLGWDGAFDTAELLDSAVEIVSVAHHYAHYELHVGLCDGRWIKIIL